MNTVRTSLGKESKIQNNLKDEASEKQHDAREVSMPDEFHPKADVL